MLKTKTIITEKATVLVVELPEGAKPLNSYCDAILYTLPNGYVETEYPVESDGSWEWQLLGRLPDITEEQASKVVDEYTYSKGETEGFFDYENDSQTDCPIESLNSLLYANYVYFENPYKDPGLIPSAELEVYRKAQSKVWNKERCYIFIKVD